MSDVEGLQALLAAVRASDGAVLVPVRAQPGARREGLTGVHAGALRIATSAAPEGGRATARIGAALAAALGVPRSAVVCVSGQGHRSKVYRVAGLSVPAAQARLREALR